MSILTSVVQKLILLSDYLCKKLSGQITKKEREA
jgi:hypothetical protein